MSAAWSSVSASRQVGSVEAETTVAAIPVVRATTTRSTTSRADAMPLIDEARRARETGLGIGIERILAPLPTKRVSPEGTVRDSAVGLAEVGRRSTLSRRSSGIMPTGSTGEWPSGKAPDSGSGDRRFESFLASQHPNMKRPPEATRGPFFLGPYPSPYPLCGFSLATEDAVHSLRGPLEGRRRDVRIHVRSRARFKLGRRGVAPAGDVCPTHRPKSREFKGELRWTTPANDARLSGPVRGQRRLRAEGGCTRDQDPMAHGQRRRDALLLASSCGCSVGGDDRDRRP